MTRAIARQAGLLRRDWRAKGQTLSYTDVTIAAVALANQVPLLTNNQKHFPEEGCSCGPYLFLAKLANPNSQAPENWAC